MQILIYFGTKPCRVAFRSYKRHHIGTLTSPRALNDSAGRHCAIPLAGDDSARGARTCGRIGVVTSACGFKA